PLTSTTLPSYPTRRSSELLVPGLRTTIRDERRLPGTAGENGPHEEIFQYDGGISEFVDYLSQLNPVTDVWRLHGEGNFTERVPVDRKSTRLNSTHVSIPYA